MSEEELKILYPIGLNITLFSAVFMFPTIFIEWFFIDKNYVIPTTLGWLFTMLIMWIIMLILGARK